MCRYCGVLIGECLAPLIRRTTAGLVQKRSMSSRVAYRPAIQLVTSPANSLGSSSVKWSFSTSASLSKKGGKTKANAKGAVEKKANSKGDGQSNAAASAAAADPYNFSLLQSDIASTLEQLKQDLSKLRTRGHFSTEVVESLRVQLNKQNTQSVKLNDVAQVIPKGRTVQILVGEKDHVKPVSSAIQNSTISWLTPQPDPTGQNPLLLLLNIPPPTAESRREVVDEAVKTGEKASTSIQDARGKYKKKLRALELNKTVRPDDLKKAAVMMQNIVNQGNAELTKVVDNAKKVLESG